MKKDEFLGTSEIKIISNIYRQSIERIVIVDGKEEYRDYYVFPCFPSDKDPIRILQMFLFGEKPQNGTDRSSYSCNGFHTRYHFRVSRFSQFIKLVSQFLKVCFKKFFFCLKSSMHK